MSSDFLIFFADCSIFEFFVIVFSTVSTLINDGWQYSDNEVQQHGFTNTANRFDDRQHLAIV